MMSAEVSKKLSQTSKAKQSKSSTRRATKETALVVLVAGDGSPFRGPAATLASAAWNRLRVYIQLIDGFPDTRRQQSIVAELLYDLLVAVKKYLVTWRKLSSDHKQLMISHVRSSILYC